MGNTANKNGSELRRRHSNDNRIMFFMLAPAIIFVFIISITPLLYTFYLSFQNYILTKPDESIFVGISNYIGIFQDGVIRESIINTFIYTFSSVIISLLVGLGLALLVNRITRGKTFFRIALFTPMMLSAVVVGVIWKFLFNNEMGVLNYLVELIGLERINWLGSATMAMISIVIADVWQWSSYTFILALAALEAINPEPIEAARIDGANSIQAFRLITLPTIFPVLEVAAVFRLIWAFRSFDLIYALTKGGPGTSTETLALEVWRQAFSRYNIGTSSAISVLMFVLLMALSVFILRNTMKKD